MKAFKATFRAYVVHEDQAAAKKSFDLVRATCMARGVDPGVATIEQVTDEEMSRLPALQALVDRKTRPAHGPAASGQERDEALHAIAAGTGGDLSAATVTITAVEAALGYLPRSVAAQFAERHTRPSVRSVA